MCSASNCYIQFSISTNDGFERLRNVVSQLAAEKAAPHNREEAEWLALFSKQELACFWWPTPEERTAWSEFWSATPVQQRFDPDMPVPPWDFGSMIDAVLSAEYELLGINSLSGDEARLEFKPQSYPYGGTDALRMLVRCFGHRIVGFDDGTGYIGGDPQPPLWRPATC